MFNKELLALVAGAGWPPATTSPTERHDQPMPVANLKRIRTTQSAKPLPLPASMPTQATKRSPWSGTLGARRERRESHSAEGSLANSLARHSKKASPRIGRGP